METLVPLGECWSEKALDSHREEVLEIVAAKKRLNEQCCRYLAAASSLLSDTYRLALEVTDMPKVARVAGRIASNEFKTSKTGSGRERIRLLSAITDQGHVLLDDTAKALANRIYLIEDDFGPSSKLLFSTLRDLALKAGYDVYSCFCPLSPYERIEHLFIPELSLGFMTQNSFLSPQITPDKVVNARRFTDHEQLRLRKKRISFNRKAAGQMLSQAAALLAESRAEHLKLESIYRSAMDYGKVDEMGERLIETLRETI